MNKYNAKRTYSTLCNRTFDSKLERERGEQLRLLEMAGEISCLSFQVKYVLSLDPKVAVVIDFAYLQHGMEVLEDAKGVLTEAARVKYAWVKDKYGIEVKLWKGK